MASKAPKTVAGLFAGIGGIERGLESAGLRSELLCEIEPAAKEVLRTRFPEVTLADDVRRLKRLPAVELVSAGFPCQDLSQAGRTAGIKGKNSGLVAEVFRLLDGREVPWLLLENVPFMLQLQRGRAMAFLIKSLEERGYAWAFRTIDARSFGLPQRRKRVILLASKETDPCNVLLADTVQEPPDPDATGLACGFYWTEGVRGLGWAVDAVPTLKGGSTVGIPSPPAILMPNGRVITPDVRDAERLQGFPVDWTVPAVSAKKREGQRWKLVGNAVNVFVARWVGERLQQPGTYDPWEDEQLLSGARWPSAAWGMDGKTYRANVSTFPLLRKSPHLADFLRYPGRSLSVRATAGFLRRARSSRLRFPPGFLESLDAHLQNELRK